MSWSAGFRSAAAATNSSGFALFSFSWVHERVEIRARQTVTATWSRSIDQSLPDFQVFSITARAADSQSGPTSFGDGGFTLNRPAFLLILAGA
jgi:hypothetical protein